MPSRNRRPAARTTARRRTPPPGVRMLGGVVLGGYLVALGINRSLVEVRGPSMEPTLWAGDRLLTVPARRSWVRPGRVVVVEDPFDPSHLTVKRVVTAEGGRVEVAGDDPARSTDSRTWGPLPIGSVRRVVLRRWPDLRTRLHR